MGCIALPEPLRRIEQAKEFKIYKMKKLIFLIRYIGTPNWYEGIEQPSIYQYLYKWRIGYRTANELYKILNG